VKRSAEQWRFSLSDHVAFFSYRWLAWVVAALALTLPGRPAGSLPRDAGLLLLIGVINVVATALAQGYVRVLRQRPALLMLDLIAGATVLWLSESRLLPFLPYALGALVLPALTFGWRGAALAAAAFSALDLFGLAVLNPAVGAGLGATALVARSLTPFAFAASFAALGRLLPRAAGAAGRAGRPADQRLRPAQPDDPAERQGPALRVVELGGAERDARAPANLASATPLLMARAAEPQAAPARRLLYDLHTSPALPLGAALEQLAAVARQSGLEVRAASSGAARPLNAAQQTVLLRVAQEALLNVQQHARAHRALIGLSFEPHAVTLVVQDDGVGLLDGTYERPGLHALRAVRYRLAELDGQLTVFESDGGGVTVRATLPIE
jgi:hypothetical protein